MNAKRKSMGMQVSASWSNRGTLRLQRGQWADAALDLEHALALETTQVGSDEKVANRDIRICHFGDREWLLNDGQIQNPLAQSYIAARSFNRAEGFWICPSFKEIPISVAPCPTLISRFATFSSQ